MCDRIDSDHSDSIVQNAFIILMGQLTRYCSMKVVKSVRELPADVAAQISSASYIRSLSHAVEELVSNAIDAKASRIDVRCSWREQSVSVADDGYGIPAADIDKIGIVQCTSKETPNEHTLGFRGVALYALCRIAHVKIVTKTREEESASTREIVDGLKVETQSSKRKRDGHGTTISATQFLQRYPVRRHFALQMRESRALLEIRNRLLQLLLPFPNIELTLRRSPDGSLLLRLSKYREIGAALSPLFGELLSCMVPVVASGDGVGITGHISLPGSPNVSTDLRLLYINQRLVNVDEIRDFVDQLWEAGTRFLKGRSQQSLYKPAYMLHFLLESSLYTVSGDPQKSSAFLADEGAGLFETLKRGLWNAWQGFLPLVALGRLKEKMFSEASRHAITPGKDDHCREAGGCEERIQMAVHQQRKRMHCIRHALTSKSRFLVARDLPSPVSDVQVEVSGELKEQKTGCQTPASEYLSDVRISRKRAHEAIEKDRFSVNRKEDLTIKDLTDLKRLGSDLSTAPPEEAGADTSELSIEEDIEGSLSSLARSTVDDRWFAEHWPAGSPPLATEEDRGTCGISIGQDSENATLESLGRLRDDPVPAQGDPSPVGQMKQSRKAMEAVNGNHGAMSIEPSVLSAPPFSRPVRRSVHRNPHISIRSSTTLHAQSSVSPVVQRSTCLPVDTESKAAPDETAIDKHNADPSLLMLRSMQKRPRRLVGKKRMLLPESDINFCSEDWKPAERQVCDVLLQSPSTPVLLERKVLENPQIIGSVDKKFILIRSGELVLAVDQHAADERVKLEQLEDLIARKLENGTLPEKLDRTIDVQLSPTELEVFLEYSEAISRWGWSGEVDAEQQTLRLSHHPCILETRFTQTDLQVPFYEECRGEGLHLGISTCSGGNSWRRAATALRA